MYKLMLPSMEQCNPAVEKQLGFHTASVTYPAPHSLYVLFLRLFILVGHISLALRPVIGLGNFPS